MIISHAKKFILVNIYKTATETINMELRQRGIQEVEVGFFLPDKHLSALEIRNRYPKLYANAFTASFVRNPWDWQVSQYMFLKKRPEHDIFKIRERFPTWRKFIEWRCSHKGKNFGYKTQTYFLSDKEGKLIVEHILKMEYLLLNFNRILVYLGFPMIYELPRRNSTQRRRDYRTFYTDKTAEVIGELYKPDIDNFGYTFDDYDTIP